MSANAKKDLKSLLEDLDNDPIRLLNEMKEAESKLGEAENIRKYQTIAVIYEFDYKVATNKKIEEEFLKLSSRYITSRVLDQDGMTRRITRFYLEAVSTRGARYEQALAYAKVIKYLGQQNLDADEVFDELVEKSIYGVIAEIEKAKSKPAEGKSERQTEAPKPKQYHLRDQQRSDDANLLESDAQEIDSRQIIGQRNLGHGINRGDVGQSNVRPIKQNESPGRYTPKRQKYPFNEDVEIAVEAPKYIDRMLRMAIHDEASVTIKRIKDQDGWTKFEMTEFERVGKLH